MKVKTIFCFVLVGTIVALAWLWQLTRSKSQHPDDRIADVGQTNAPMPAKETKPVSAVKSSPAIHILAHPTEMPALSTLAKLKPADEDGLLIEYQRKTNMFERIALVWSLAYIGGDASLAAFRHTLTDEFAGRQLSSGHGEETSNEANLMHQLIWAIGVAAQKNDTALDFLKQGTDPWFWQKNVKWKSNYFADNYGILAETAMTAIGMSGRREVPEIFEALTKLPLINEADPNVLKRTLNGALVDAAFFNSIVREEGHEGFLQWFLTPKGHVFDSDGKFARWSATADGRKWHQWSDEREKVNLVKQEERLQQAFPKPPQ